MSAGLTSVRVTGALLPSDILAAVLAGDLDGLNGSAYHLGSERPREAAARVWTHLLGVYRRFRTDLASLPEDDPAVGLTRERWLMLRAVRARLRTRPADAGRWPDRGRQAVPGQPPVGLHPDPPAGLGRELGPAHPRRARARLNGHRTRWCRSCSTAPTTTCGEWRPTVACSGCCATPPP